MINPYKELSPYLEADTHRFKGRSEEIVEMFECFDRNDYLVCHADSGEGKTSIIDAGLIPKMKENCYLPIRIIFKSDKHFINNDINFDDVICGIIENEIEKLERNKNLSIDIIYPKRLVNSEEHELNDWEKELINSCTWLKLRYTRITIDRLLYTPVLIFDQFEEVFTNPTSQEWTDKFFAWMQELSMDICPQKIVAEIEKHIGKDDFPEISTQKNFKCIFSLRSEYIGKLDYWGLQRHYIPFLKNNRYLLRPLTIKGAKEVITQQEGYDGLNDVADDIINILRKSQKGKNYVKDELSDLPCIPALFLSIICAQAFIMPPQELSAFIQSIAAENDEDKKAAIDTLIEKFYENAISKCDIPSKDMDIIEDILVNNDGNRQRVSSQTDTLKEIEFAKKYMKKLEKARLIRVIPEYNREEDSIELVHDALCPVIAQKKEQRIAEQAEKAKRKAEEAKKREDQREEMTSSLFLLALLVFGIWVLSIIYRNKEVADNIRIYDTKTILTIANLAILPFIFYSSIKKLKTSFWLSLYGIISNVILTYFFLFGQTNEMGLRWSISVFAIGVPIVSLFYSFKFKLYGIPDRKERETINTSISLWLFWWLMSFYIFYLTVFNAEIWLPKPSISCWGVLVIPFLTYEIVRICFKQQRHKMAFGGIYCLLFLLAFNTSKFCKPFLFSDHNIVLGIIFATMFFFIWAYKDLTWRKRVIAVLLNFMVLCVVVIMNLGFNPLKVNYNSVSHVYNWINVTVQNEDGHKGIISACSGDTILPCLFDSIKDHYCYINSRKLTYNTDIISYNEFYEYKKADATAKWKFPFIDIAERNILECKNARDTTRFDSLHIYAAKTYYEVRNNNLNYLVSGKRYLLDDLKSIGTLTRLQHHKMAAVLEKMKSSRITDALAAAFNKEFARSFYLCMLKDRIVQQDSVNIFSLTQEMFLLYFYDAADFEYTANTKNTINFKYNLITGGSNNSGNFHRIYKSTYTAADLRKDKVDSWYNYVDQLFATDLAENAKNYEKNINSRATNVQNNLQNIQNSLKQKSNQNLDKMLGIVQKGDKISQEDIKEAFKTYQNQLTFTEDVINQVNTQIDQIEIEKREIDGDFQKLIHDVFETLSYIVLNNQNIFNAEFVDICEQLYIVSALRQYEMAPIYMRQLEEMDNAKNGLYLELKKFHKGYFELIESSRNKINKLYDKLANKNTL